MPSRKEIDYYAGRLQALLKTRGYSPRTKATYGRWLARFLKSQRGPVDRLNRTHVESFLGDLASQDRLAPKSRNQAASALAFFFREVLGNDELSGTPRSREPKRIPIVLSRRQARMVLDHLHGKYHLLGSLMYGAGLRLTEAHRLRLMDLDFDLGQIAVRDGKGGKDRWVMLPFPLTRVLHRRIERVATLHAADRTRGAGWAALPHALARKDPSAGYELGWQFLFPASRWSRDPATGRFGRYHLDPSATQRKVKQAGKECRIPKPVTCHTLRRSFATEMLRAGYDVHTVQKLMGHRDVRTTMLYVEAVTDAGVHIRSPLDLDDRRD